MNKKLNEEELRKNRILQNKAIEELMFETMKKARKLGCSIQVNPKTGKMNWSKFEEIIMNSGGAE